VRQHLTSLVQGIAASGGYYISMAVGDTPDTIIERRGFKQLTDDGAITALVDEVIAASPEQVEAMAKEGKR